MKRFVIMLFTVVGLGWWLWPSQPSHHPQNSIAEMLSAPAEKGFAQALLPRVFQFPQDDGPHPQFQTEWWYWTGNLDTLENRHFGYQLTFFRRALRPQPRQGTSKWGTHQIYFAHFTLSDTATGQFYFKERFSRNALGLAGAQANPFAVWLDQWHAKGDLKTTRLHAQEKEFGIQLTLASLKPEVLHGQRGLSQKNSGRGHASYYYSRPRLKTSGKINVAGKSFDVRGLSWLDREWSTSVLGADQQGWDWFSLQLEDGRELMLYQLRQKTGEISAFSAGSLIDHQGQVTHLKAQDFKITPLSTWKSPHTGITYPASWSVQIPKHGLDLTLTPWQANQELNSQLIYWEGAVKVSGSGVKGNGYVELTGYGE